MTITKQRDIRGKIKEIVIGTVALLTTTVAMFSTATVLTILMLTAGPANAADPTVTFDTTIGPPPATNDFDISFVKNDADACILADRKNNAVDLFVASTSTFFGFIGNGGFVGPSTPACAVPHACGGPNGVLIDNNNNVWAADGPASACETPDCFCAGIAGQTTSMVKEYVLGNSLGAMGRLACLDTGGNFRADEMAFDPSDALLIVTNDADGFLSVIMTSGIPAIVDQFFYADNDVGKPASVAGLSTPGGGIGQPVWAPRHDRIYQALPQGTTVGRVDVFNLKLGNLIFLRSINVPSCPGGPSGLAINNADELLAACGNGVALIDAKTGKVTRSIPVTTTLGGADEIWFDPGSNAWYVAAPGELGVISSSPGHPFQDVTHEGCCGHSVAAYTASNSKSLVFDPNAAGTGISVFEATTP